MPDVSITKEDIMRELMRSVAKGRMKALGADRVNRRLKMTDQNGVPNWRRVLTGDLAARGESAIRVKKALKSRKIRRVEK
jgi:hypothetical protein